jgi:bifunctional DNA-binding transcriptional regulator/antitoxin component of YhaV-PrlF toxin-antitoxin module
MGAMGISWRLYAKEEVYPTVTVAPPKMKTSDGRILVEKNGCHYVCVPRRIARSLGWKKGEPLVIYRNEENELVVYSKNGSNGDQESSRSKLLVKWDVPITPLRRKRRRCKMVYPRVTD